MTAEPIVSVVMAVYDGESHLKEAVESVLGQSFQDFELIIIDDGSTDSTPDILRAYEEADERVRVYAQERKGLIDSLNLGCGLATGRYIARMDADDIAFPDRLQRQLDFLEDRPEVVLLGGAYVLIDEQGVPGVTLYKPQQQQQIVRAFSRYANPFLHPAIVMRTEVFRELEGYRGAFLHAEDYDLWLRVSERYETANLPDPVLSYRVHHGQVSHQNLRQGIISVLGAQVSARSRRESGREPSWRGGRVTEEQLHELGVPGEVLKKALTEACFWQANLMLLCGYGETARALFEEALRHSGSSPLRRRLAGAVLRGHAETQEKPGGRWRRVRLEVLLISSAFATRFRLGAQLLWDKCSRVLDHLRRRRDDDRTRNSGSGGPP